LSPDQAPVAWAGPLPKPQSRRRISSKPHWIKPLVWPPKLGIAQVAYSVKPSTTPKPRPQTPPYWLLPALKPRNRRCKRCLKKPKTQPRKPCGKLARPLVRLPSVWLIAQWIWAIAQEKPSPGPLPKRKTPPKISAPVAPKRVQGSPKKPERRQRISVSEPNRPPLPSRMILKTFLI